MGWMDMRQSTIPADALDMVVVVTADPLYGETGDEPWQHEKANINLVDDFIASFTTE
jgi:hypothetical protein